MNIHQERREPHSIQAYGASEVTINHQRYSKNIIVSANELLSSWHVDPHQSVTEIELQPLLTLHPEVILIGSATSIHIDLELKSQLTQQRIGLECMSIGAASRTFNILLSESRRVVLGLIF